HLSPTEDGEGDGTGRKKLNLGFNKIRAPLGAVDYEAAARLKFRDYRFPRSRVMLKRLRLRLGRPHTLGFPRSIFMARRTRGRACTGKRPGQHRLSMAPRTRALIESVSTLTPKLARDLMPILKR